MHLRALTPDELAREQSRERWRKLALIDLYRSGPYGDQEAIDIQLNADYPKVAASLPIDGKEVSQSDMQVQQTGIKDQLKDIK